MLTITNFFSYSYNVRNVYYFDDVKHKVPGIPRYMHMLNHLSRAVNFTKPNQFVKSFHNPERVLTLHNHFPLACLGGPCKSFSIETDDAQLQHYRADCVKTLKKSCEDFKEHRKEDSTILKFKDQLIFRTTKTLDALNFFKALPKSTNREYD